MTDRQATQVFTVLNILSSHGGEKIHGVLLGTIQGELETAITTGPSAWAFQENNNADK